MKKNEEEYEDLSFAALRSMMWHYKGRFLLIDSLRIVATLVISLHPYFIAQFASSMNDKPRAFLYLMLLLISGMFHWVFWHSADFLLVKLIHPLLFKFKHISFAMFWNKKYTSFIEMSSGKVGYYVNQFPNQIYQLLDSYSYGFIVIAASLPVYVGLLLLATWQTSLIYVAFLIAILAVLIALTKPMTKHQRKYTDADSTNSGRVFDSYANFVNVFSFRAQGKEIQQNYEDLENVTALNIKADFRVMNYWAASSFMMRGLLWSAVIFYSWHMYDTGQISFAALVTSITVLFDLTHQFWNVVHHLGQWNKIQSTYKESYNYLFPGQNIVKEYFEDNQPRHSSNKIHFDRSLEIKNLSFAYPDAPNHKVLKNINLTVAKNEKIGIVGKSGSGKSTLVKILLGFYNIDELENVEGSILIDNNNVHSNNLSQLYAYVPQDTTLFQETIFYNIAYAKDGDASLEEVIDAAQKAHISEFIESLPNGYETLVGERGIKLSLGQRQRIAIARAFLKESELLILDEATSSLDSRTEGYVQESFERLWSGKSVIAIAHRLSTLNNVDRIIVMNKGEIVEEGTKEELLALNGYFSDLWNHQRKGMI